MPKYHKNFNNLGRASCIGLLFLTFLLINPTISSASALEEASDSFDNANSSAITNGSDTDAGIMPIADIPSTVGISFSPASGSTSLTPTTATGQSAQVNVLASVNVSNSGGYAVYLKGNSVNLVGQKDSNNVIAGISATKTYDDMDVNTWGYSASEGTTVPEGATYKAISVSGNGDKLVENANKKITSDTKNIMLSFAAKVNDQKPADTYKNTITMSVVSSPRELTELAEITDMQQMTSTVCSNAKVGDTKQLRDTRDGKYYWIRKMSDNNCWMVQNLALDLKTGQWPEVDKTDHDIPTTEYEPTSTQTSISADTTDSSSTNTLSYNFGNYVIKNPIELDSCEGPHPNAASCASLINVSGWTASTNPEYFKDNGATYNTSNKTYDAHYLIGNYYSWNTATAGTGNVIEAGEAPGSICPKGWKLPTSNQANTVDGSFNKLVQGLSLTQLMGDGYFFVRGGNVAQSPEFLFFKAGDYSTYWASNAQSVDNAYNLGFWDTYAVAPSNYAPKSSGVSVRCLAR